MSNKEIQSILEQEIDWHKNNKDKANMPDEWINGFMGGLEQAKLILIKYSKLK